MHQLFREELAAVTGAFAGEVEVKTRGERDDEGGVLERIGAGTGVERSCKRQEWVG